jgi:glycine cleavage system regulatory protein
MKSLNDFGLATSLHEADNPDSMQTKASLPLKLEVISMDHPGIVQHVVHILKEHNVCILSLDTEIKAMPHTGAPIFDLNLEASVPAGQSIAKVKDELEDMASEMDLDLIFKS